MLGGRLLLRGDSVPETELHIAGRACDERVCVAAVVNLTRAAFWVGAAGEVGHVLDGLVNHVGKIPSKCMLLVRVQRGRRDGLFTYDLRVSPSAYSSISRITSGLLHIGHVRDPSFHSFDSVCDFMCCCRQTRHTSDRHLQSLAAVVCGYKSVCFSSQHTGHSLLVPASSGSPYTFASCVDGVAGLDCCKLRLLSWASSSYSSAKALKKQIRSVKFVK